MIYGHWKLAIPDFLPSEYYGFVYEITNKLNGRKYIGKRNFGDNRWQQYTSSSKYLKADITAFGKEHFTFLILAVYFDSKTQNEAEVQFQEDRNVLKEELPNGDRAYYNMSIGGAKFNTSGRKRPVEEIEAMTARMKGKSYEDLHGETKAKEMKLVKAQQQIAANKSRIGKTYEELFGSKVAEEKKAACGKATKGKSYTEIHGEERAKEIKEQKSASLKGQNEGKTYVEIHGAEKAKAIREKKSQSMKKARATKKAALALLQTPSLTSDHTKPIFRGLPSQPLAT